MPAAERYIDTSALAKRYVDEAGPDDLNSFLNRWPCVLIRRLAVVEFRCVLQRRLRAAEIDVRRGLFQVEPWRIAMRSWRTT